MHRHLKDIFEIYFRNIFRQELFAVLPPEKCELIAPYLGLCLRYGLFRCRWHAPLSSIPSSAAKTWALGVVMIVFRLRASKLQGTTKSAYPHPCLYCEPVCLQDTLNALTPGGQGASGRPPSWRRR